MGQRTGANNKILRFLFLMFLVFPLVIPDGMSSLSLLTYKLIYGYWKYLSYLIITLLFFLCSHGKLKFRVILLFLFFAFPVIPSLIYGIGLSNWFHYYGICVVVVMLMEVYKGYLDEMLLTFYTVLEFWIYVNFVFMAIYPDGMYYIESNHSNLCWILGYKSSFQYYIFPAVCFGWLNLKYRGQKMRMTALLAVSILEAIISQNTMLTVGLVLFVLFFAFRIYEFKLANIQNYMIAVLIINIVFVFFTSLFINSSLGTFILTLLGKNGKLSLRSTIIWNRTLEYIAKRPLLGNGVLSSAKRVSIYNYLSAIHAHNQLLEYAFQGGAALLSLYFIINILICKEIRKYKTLPAAQCLAVCIFIMYAMVTVEIYSRGIAGPVWVMILLPFYLKEIDGQFRANKDKRLFVFRSR